MLVVPLVGGLAALAVPGAVPGAAPSAEASSTYLCTGYSGCNAAGYSDAGYGSHNRTMYWQMYSGHNCTNYVAYRMVKAGMANSRPWNGDGMARNWGPANPGITDQTPAVGAVAWFARGLSGGADGHVAYVEKVISPTQIVISEDSWSGDFHWAVLTKDGGTWPSGFIHFVDQKTVKPAIAPKVSGTAQVGVPLTAARGAWKPTGATFSYQWLADGKPVTGATLGRFTPTADQVGQALSVTVTARKDGYVTGAATTPATAPVVPGVLATGTAPVLSGDPQLGETLTVAPGSWTPSPDTTGLRWKADGKVIPGATGTSLALTSALVDKTITVAEVVRKDGYAKATQPSNPVGPVVARPPLFTAPYRASGAARYGSTLALGGGQTSPSDVDVTYAWYRDGVVVPGATAEHYAVTAADVGHKLGAVMTFTKLHYEPVKRTYLFGDAVTTHPTLQLRALPKKRAANVTVHLTAPGVDAVTGPVTVAIGDHRVSGTVVDGVFHTRIVGLTPGFRRVVVTYAGTSVVEATHAAQKIKVQR